MQRNIPPLRAGLAGSLLPSPELMKANARRFACAFGSGLAESGKLESKHDRSRCRDNAREVAGWNRLLSAPKRGIFCFSGGLTVYTF